MQSLTIILVTVMSTLGVSRAQEVPYYKGDVYGALSHAQSQHKMLVVEFYASWNSRSRWLSEKVIARPDVYKAIDESFVIIKIDTQDADGAKLADLYQIKDYPALVIFNVNGNVIDKIDKTMTATDFVARLGQIVIENDGKSGWELNQIFQAANDNDRQRADMLTQKYIARIGTAKAITTYHRELFSNTAVVYFGSKTFDFMLANRVEFEKAYTKPTVDAIIDAALFEAVMPYSTGVYQYDEPFIEGFEKTVTDANTTFKRPLILMCSLARYRAEGDADKTIATTEVLLRDIGEEYTTRLLLSLEFVAENGSREQKNSVRTLIQKYGRQTKSTSELMLLNLLSEQISK